jgi:hypothetical protein
VSINEIRDKRYFTIVRIIKLHLAEGGRGNNERTYSMKLGKVIVLEIV